MKTVTNGFKEQITKLGREIDFKFFLHTNDKIITEDGNFLMTQDNRHLVVEQFDDEEVDETITGEDIYNVSIVSQGNILSTLMKELDFEIKQDLRIGDVIGCQFGLKVDGDYEYIDYGKYMVYSKEFNEDTKTYSYVAFDRMLLTMKETTQDFLTGLDGDTLAFAIYKICEEVGLSYTATQEELTKYPNLSKNINEGTFTDMQITYRDILDMICQALGLSMITDGSQLKLKALEDNSSYFIPYTIEGNITQEGTPTPDTPAEIVTITGEITHNNKTINLGNIELCKIGNFKDYIYKNDNKWYLHKEIGKIVLDGSENWATSSAGSNCYRYTLSSSKIVTDSYTDILVKSDKYLGINHYQTNFSNYDYAISQGTNHNIILKNKDITSVANLKTLLSNSNTVLYYVLDTITEEEITNDNLVNQLNAAGTETITINEEYIKDTNVSFGEKYMINSVVLSRSEDFDNINRKDEESIAENGIHEFKIKDNLIMLYDDREDYIDEIFDQLNGLEYYINDYSSTGITYLDWLDFYNVKIGDKSYKCLMLNDEININQGLEENIYTEEPEETVTDYKTSSKTDKEVSFIVDKQNGSIRAKVNKGDVINEINLDETGASINANKISLAGKTIEMTSDNIAINSTNFKVDKNGNITANNVTLNSGTFKGNINTSQNCTVGNDLYIGQNQSSTDTSSRNINFAGGTRIEKWFVNGDEYLQIYTNGIFNVQNKNAGGFMGNLLSLTYNKCGIGGLDTQTIDLNTNNIVASTQITVGSDERLKQKIEDVDTSWIDELKVKEFEYIKIPNKKQIGLIAQDYEDKEYAKYFLNKNDDGYYSIAYGNITNALIQYCQEMKKEINSLKEEIKQLKESDK